MGRVLPVKAVVAVLAALVGFLAVSQLRGTERANESLEAESEEDLARILGSLNTQADSLRDEITDLRVQLQALEDSSRRDDTAVATARQQLAALEVLAGTVPVRGQGVLVVITDPVGSLTYDAIIDVVQELRDAGAEAITINDRRVAATTAFAEREGAIVVDGVALTQPYRVAAIGGPDTLESGLSIPGGALDTLRASRDVTVTVQRQPDVVISALTSPPTFRAARPVSSGE